MARVWIMGALLLLGFLVVGRPVAYGFQFRVGGRRGWIKPAGADTETYNDWASRNRFQVGDTLYFKYDDDSVLVVDQKHYDNCNASNPIEKFTAGNTTFTFDHYGFFYFISGKKGHCKSGQKLIVRVMVHNDQVQAAPPATPGPTGRDHSGYAAAPGKSSAEKIGHGSSLILAVLGYVFVV